MSDITFESLGLNQALLATLREEGYREPTPIQSKAIPSLLDGRDLMGCAQTGTGKTAAFALPIIQRLAEKRARREPRKARALVVAPTRELAAQIDASFAAYGRGAGLTRACVCGGVGKVPQARALSRGVDVLVATPGRLLDLLNDGAVRLDSVETVVFDEADRLLDMGFVHDVRRIVALLPEVRQTLLFSATIPSGIRALADTILKDPVRVEVSPEQPAVELIEQKLMYVEKGDKKALLVALLKGAEVARSIVFTKTKHGANRLAESLTGEGIRSDAIHSNKSQSQRTRTLDAFRGGRLKVLVATDLAARGIDVDGITHVFNYELPHEPEVYVHRIGRTARAGTRGVAVTLCDSEERTLLRDIERLLGKRVPVEIDHPFRAAFRPEERRGGGNRALPPRTLGGHRAAGPEGRSSRGYSPRAAEERSSGTERRSARYGRFGLDGAGRPGGRGRA